MKTMNEIKRKDHALCRRCLSAVVLLLFSTITLFASYPPPIPSGWSDGFVYANGIRIHYYQAVPATGKPVMVMVHGVTDNGLCWADLSLKLQDDYNIYMLDARGHGLTDPFTPSDNGNTLIEDVVAFVNAMELEKPIIVGHSMGAATVMRVGAEYPDLAKAVIMLDPGLPRKDSKGLPPAPRKSKKEEVKSKTMDAKALPFTMYGDPEVLVAQNNYSYDALIEKGRRENSKWSETDIKYWALSKKQYHGPYTDAAWQAMHGTMKTGNALSKIPVPSLILKADASPENRQANEESVKELKQVKLVHIHKAGHNLHHDQLDATEKEIRDFLSTL